jgi:hypothetical protein
MATVDKDFRIKAGLVVEGANATVNGEDIITTGSSTDDLAEGTTNKYFTDQRAVDAVSDEIDTAVSTAIDALDTDDIEEGAVNQYYTTARAKGDAADLLTNATLTNITITGNEDGLTITAENGGIQDLTGFDTDDLSEGATNQFFRVPFNPLLNNAFSLVTSSKYLNIDYETNNIIPSNNNSLVTSLLSNINDANYSYLNSPVQDINYTLYRHITPRYNGSKLTGTLYNTYTPGDKSYGKDPVINLHTIKFAYFKEITSQSRTLPGRSNVNVKYLIDSASNITELTEANRNIFDLRLLDLFLDLFFRFLDLFLDLFFPPAL